MDTMSRVLVLLLGLPLGLSCLYFGTYRLRHPDDRYPPWRGNALLTLLLLVPQVLTKWSSMSDRTSRLISAMLSVGLGLALLIGVLTWISRWV